MKRLALVSILTAGLLVAACSNQQAESNAAHAAPAAPLESLATNRQVMLGLAIPASDVLFQIADNVPADDAGWDRVVANAVMLGEAGNMMLSGARLLPQPEWSQHARDLVTRAKVAAEAAQKHDVDAVLDAGNAIYETCDACHNQFMPAKVAERAAQAPAQ
jgi:hypothetical protein